MASGERRAGGWRVDSKGMMAWNGTCVSESTRSTQIMRSHISEANAVNCVKKAIKLHSDSYSGNRPQKTPPSVSRDTESCTKRVRRNCDAKRRSETLRQKSSESGGRRTLLNRQYLTTTVVHAHVEMTAPTKRATCGVCGVWCDGERREGALLGGRSCTRSHL